jgi:hypothetical protein
MATINVVVPTLCNVYYDSVEETRRKNLSFYPIISFTVTSQDAELVRQTSVLDGSSMNRAPTSVNMFATMYV